LETVKRLRVGFGRDMSLLTGSMFTRRIVMGFLQVVRAIYFALLGFSPVEIGLLLSIATFLSAIHHITFGYLCDRYGRKPFLILGTFFAAARTALFAVSTDFWMLALAQGLGAMGEGVGAGQPVVSGYITDKVDARDRPNIYSTMAITNGIATTIGLSFGGLPILLENRFAYDVVSAHQLLWWACTVVNLVSLVFLFPLNEGARVARGGSKGKGSGIKNWGVIAKFSLTRSTSGLGWGMIDSLMTLYFFQRFMVGTDILGPIYAFARFLSIFTYLVTPRVVERYGAIPTIVTTRMLSAAVTVMFALSSWYPMAVSLMVLNRIIVLFTMPIRQTFASGLVSPEETATAIGISNSARMGVRTLAPTLAGYMFESISLTLPFFTGAVLMVINGGLFWAFFRPRELETPPNS
jgi:DHA1 family multidrug resistance protein-like MFS transporter